MLKRGELTFALALCLMLAIGSVANAQTATAPKAQSDNKVGTYFFWSGKRLGVVAEDQEGQTGKGALVKDVFKESAADRAGIRAGDLIVEIDGKPVESTRDLRRKVSDLEYEKPVTLRVIREGASVNLSVMLDKRNENFYVYGHSARLSEEARREARERAREARERAREAREQTRALTQLMRSRGRLGVNLQDLNEQLGQFFGVEKGNGVLITSVVENSAAAKAGFKAGDVVVEVNGVAVNDADDFRRELNKVEAGDVRFTVVREKRRMELRATVEKRNARVENVIVDLHALENLDNLPDLFVMPDIDIPEIVIPEFDVTPGIYQFDCPDFIL